MSCNYTRTHLNFHDNLYVLHYKSWVHISPDEYYHAHEGMEFLYIHEGSGRLILNDRLYTLKPRTLVYFQPYQVHLVRYELPRLRTIVKVNLPQLQHYLPMFPYLAEFVSFLEKSRESEQIVQLSPKQDDDLNGLFALLHQTLSTVPPIARKEQFVVFWMQFMSYLKAHVFTESLSKETATPRPSHHAEKIAAWIDRHYKEPFNLEKLAADIHLSGSYLSNLFRSFTGNTITEHIMRKRLDEARNLLANTSLSIDQVGKQSGFPNPAYFSRCFKKQHKVSPQQYRTIAAKHRLASQGKALSE